MANTINPISSASYAKYKREISKNANKSETDKKFGLTDTKKSSQTSNTKAKDDAKAKSKDIVSDSKKHNPDDTNTSAGKRLDEEKKPVGLFTEEQTKFLKALKDDPDNKRLVDNQTMGREQFMNILLKQLANQNPLNPMQDKDFIAQMAQFSSLEGMKNLNDSFKGLSKDVAAIKNAIGQPGAVDVEYITYLKEMHKLIKAIGKKLGVEFEEETQAGASTDAKSESKKTNEKIKEKKASDAYNA